MPYKCAECFSDGARLNNCLEIRLCENCSKLEEYTLVYKTYIKKDYMIDIEELSHCDTYTRIVHRNTEATLYKLSDILDVFCIVYKIDRNNKKAIEDKRQELIQEKEKKLEARREKARLKKKSERKQRRQELMEELNKYGLELRGDSKLCMGYIDGTICNWDMNEIVERMCQMRYLYDYCDMDKLLEQVKKSRKGDRWDHDTSVFDDAEFLALNKCKGYFVIWPWMIPNQQAQ